LVLGQAARPSRYFFRDYTLYRRAFTLLSASSPAFKRIFTELAQAQVFRRHLCSIDPMLSVMMPGRRFDLPPDLTLFQHEIDREFGEVRRVVDDLYSNLVRVNATADAAFDRDLCWPPGTFWERRETNSVAANLPYVRPEKQDLLAEFPPNHPYLDLIYQSAAFASHLAPGPRTMPSFATARLHGAWTRGVFGVAGGEDEVIDFLAERITSLGGQVSFSERAVGLDIMPDKSMKLIIDGQMSTIGAQFVVTDEPGESLAQLSQGRHLQRGAQHDWPIVTTRAGRFVVSIVVSPKGLPESLGAESFIFSRMPGGSPDPLSPVIHLQRLDRLVSEDGPPKSDDTCTLVAEIILAQPGTLSLSDARDFILGAVLAQFPFLKQHLLLVDSPHDGLPIWVYANSKRSNAERMESRGAFRNPEPMSPLIVVDPVGYMGICGEPLRGPIPHTYLVGRSVMPALGQEGELIAAWGVARIITKSDKRRQRMRRDMWSRLDFG
jgi:hypothetical protein